MIECQSFRANPIFQELTIEEFEANKLKVNDLSENTFLRYKNIPEADEVCSLLFQFSIDKTAIILSLSDKKVSTVDTSREIRSF